jgi:hypothetical protein
MINVYSVSRDRVVSVATRCGHDGPGFATRSVLSTRPDRPLGPNNFPLSGYWVSYPWVKRQGLGVDY